VVPSDGLGLENHLGGGARITLRKPSWLFILGSWLSSSSAGPDRGHPPGFPRLPIFPPVVDSLHSSCPLPLRSVRQPWCSACSAASLLGAEWTGQDALTTRSRTWHFLTVVISGFNMTFPGPAPGLVSEADAEATVVHYIAGLPRSQRCHSEPDLHDRVAHYRARPPLSSFTKHIQNA